MISLREHQIRGVDMVRESIKRGHKRIMLGAPCSWGKTHFAAHLMEQGNLKGKRGVFIADRINLVDQCLSKFEETGIECGVYQGMHPKYNPKAPAQIASIQTLSRRNRMLDFDFAIIDEAHICYEYTKKMMEAYNNVIFIGLSATPYSKGLGKYYSDLIVPSTPRQLLDKGYLCPLKYYIGEPVDLHDVKLKRIRGGGSDFDVDQLSVVMDKPKIVGDTVKEWIDICGGGQTIAFNPKIKNSVDLVRKFMENGVSARHIDAYTDPDERRELFAAHDAGEFHILSCSTLLDTGYDAPGVLNIIDRFPTASIIRYIQRAGRLMRIFPGKIFGRYLDQAGNWDRFGKAEDIYPSELDDGSKNFKEEKLAKKEKKEKKERRCECCSAVMAGLHCDECGHTIPPPKEEVESVEGKLVELQSTDYSFYGGLLYIAKEKGYSEGWAKHVYKEKFKSWPRGYCQPEEPSSAVQGFVKHRNIKNAFSRKRKDKSIINQALENI